jgi:hypothetical protein
MAAEVFISYSRRDEEFVLRLVNDLEDRQAFAWIDRADIVPGDQWRKSIEDGIRACSAFVLVISPDSLRSSNVAEELTFALENGKPILPLVYRRARVSAELEARLRTYQYLDFTRGGYAQNLLDLVEALAHHGITLEIDREALVRRRDERLGAGVATDWRAVVARVPGWALAWSLGWGVFWLVVMVGLALLFKDLDGGLEFWPFGGLVGGLIGGLIAGAVTMVALRHNAISIRWRHMSPTIRIWGIVGPLGILVSFGIAFAGLAQADSGRCAASGVTDCVVQVMTSDAGTAVILYSVASFFLIGAVAGWLSVRHIRRLEPGILGSQAIVVVIGWAVGSVVAVIAWSWGVIVAWLVFGSL